MDPFQNLILDNLSQNLGLPLQANNFKNPAYVKFQTAGIKRISLGQELAPSWSVHNNNSFTREIKCQALSIAKGRDVFGARDALFNKICKVQHKQLLKAEISNPCTPDIFYNYSFDKGRIKSLVSWSLKHYGEHKTINLLENLKQTGFQYATKAGISLGIEDLKIPPKKAALIYEAEEITKQTNDQYARAEITGVERFQRLIDTWHRTSEQLKAQVVNCFENTDILNPVYMMAFSGARGNISQVRQLVGMRGLMADPKGQIIDYPIRSNFREGLTLTEYIISCYGARKGIVDTALRTANAGYLTRRLVDVAQHVIVSNYDCGSLKGVFITDMKEGNKTLYSLQSRLVGRVLARDLFLTQPNSDISIKTESNNSKIASRNQEISTDLAFQISKHFNQVFVRSPLTCYGTFNPSGRFTFSSGKKFICQLCYGWSLAQGKLVSIGEAVGIVAGQAIGEPGTQLTMRTFHTGGAFSGDTADQIRAPYEGFIHYFGKIPGSLIRTPEGKIAFLTKVDGFMCVYNNNIEISKAKQFKIPAYTILYYKNNERVLEKQVIAQISSISQQQTDESTLTVRTPLQGQFFVQKLQIQEKHWGPNPKLVDSDPKGDGPLYVMPRPLISSKMLSAWDWGYAWILSCQRYKIPFFSHSQILTLVPKKGDFIDTNCILAQIQWVLPQHGGNVTYLNYNPLLLSDVEGYASSSLASSAYVNDPHQERAQTREMQSFKTFTLSSNTVQTAFNYNLGILKKAVFNIPNYMFKKVDINKNLLSLDIQRVKYRKIGYFADNSKYLFFLPTNLKGNSVIGTTNSQSPSLEMRRQAETKGQQYSSLSDTFSNNNKNLVDSLSAKLSAAYKPIMLNSKNFGIRVFPKTLSSFGDFCVSLDNLCLWTNQKKRNKLQKSSLDTTIYVDSKGQIFKNIHKWQKTESSKNKKHNQRSKTKQKAKVTKNKLAQVASLKNITDFFLSVPSLFYKPFLSNTSRVIKKVKKSSQKTKSFALSAKQQSRLYSSSQNNSFQKQNPILLKHSPVNFSWAQIQEFTEEHTRSLDRNKPEAKTLNKPSLVPMVPNLIKLNRKSKITKQLNYLLLLKTYKKNKKAFGSFVISDGDSQGQKQGFADIGAKILKKFKKPTPVNFVQTNKTAFLGFAYRKRKSTSLYCFDSDCLQLPTKIENDFDSPVDMDLWLQKTEIEHDFDSAMDRTIQAIKKLGFAASSLAMPKSIVARLQRWHTNFVEKRDISLQMQRLADMRRVYSFYAYRYTWSVPTQAEQMMEYTNPSISSPLECLLNFNFYTRDMLKSAYLHKHPMGSSAQLKGFKTCFKTISKKVSKSLKTQKPTTTKGSKKLAKLTKNKQKLSKARKLKSAAQATLPQKPKNTRNKIIFQRLLEQQNSLYLHNTFNLFNKPFAFDKDVNRKNLTGQITTESKVSVAKRVCCSEQTLIKSKRQKVKAFVKRVVKNGSLEVTKAVKVAQYFDYVKKAATAVTYAYAEYPAMAKTNLCKVLASKALNGILWFSLENSILNSQKALVPLFKKKEICAASGFNTKSKKQNQKHKQVKNHTLWQNIATHNWFYKTFNINPKSTVATKLKSNTKKVLAERGNSKQKVVNKDKKHNVNNEINVCHKNKHKLVFDNKFVYSSFINNLRNLWFLSPLVTSSLSYRWRGCLPKPLTQTMGKNSASMLVPKNRSEQKPAQISESTLLKWLEKRITQRTQRNKKYNHQQSFKQVPFKWYLNTKLRFLPSEFAKKENGRDKKAPSYNAVNQPKKASTIVSQFNGKTLENKTAQNIKNVTNINKATNIKNKPVFYLSFQKVNKYSPKLMYQEGADSSSLYTKGGANVKPQSIQTWKLEKQNQFFHKTALRASKKEQTIAKIGFYKNNTTNRIVNPNQKVLISWLNRDKNGISSDGTFLISEPKQVSVSMNLPKPSPKPKSKERKKDIMAVEKTLRKTGQKNKVGSLNKVKNHFKPEKHNPNLNVYVSKKNSFAYTRTGLYNKQTVSFSPLSKIPNASLSIFSLSNRDKKQSITKGFTHKIEHQILKRSKNNAGNWLTRALLTPSLQKPKGPLSPFGITYSLPSIFDYQFQTAKIDLNSMHGSSILLANSYSISSLSSLGDSQEMRKTEVRDPEGQSSLNKVVSNLLVQNVLFKNYNSDTRKTFQRIPTTWYKPYNMSQLLGSFKQVSFELNLTLDFRNSKHGFLSMPISTGATEKAKSLKVLNNLKNRDENQKKPLATLAFPKNLQEKMFASKQPFSANTKTIKTTFKLNFDNVSYALNSLAKTSFLSTYTGELLGITEKYANQQVLFNSALLRTSLDNTRTQKSATENRLTCDLNIRLPKVDLRKIDYTMDWDTLTSPVSYKHKQRMLFNKNRCLLLTKKDLLTFCLSNSVSSQLASIVNKVTKTTGRFSLTDKTYPILNNGLVSSVQIQKSWRTTVHKVDKTKQHKDFEQSQITKNLKMGSFVLRGQAPNVIDSGISIAGDGNAKPKVFPVAGQIIGAHQISDKVTLRKGQPVFISEKSNLHIFPGDFVDKNQEIITLVYQKLKAGDIVEGIPKVEQIFEARTTKRGRLFRENLPYLLKGLFIKYYIYGMRNMHVVEASSNAPQQVAPEITGTSATVAKKDTGKRKVTLGSSYLALQWAVNQSFYKIQQVAVDGVLRVYRSQGVSISDKHLEIIVKQMTTKVRVIKSGQTGFFPGELVDLELVEKINTLLIGSTGRKVYYEPVILGITRASLQVDSFLSSASFQQTSRILSHAAIYHKRDFLKGIKENIIIGNLIPAGTGFVTALDAKK
jgi:RNA polymerase Rpb1, domain 5/RNA polymerase Rpb1, domain 4